MSKRKIDETAFAEADQERYAEWKEMYAEMHPNSFYAAVKMVINDVRRRYWLREAVRPAQEPREVEQPKAVVRRAVPGKRPALEEMPTPPEAGKGEQCGIMC